jgi:hypothetical protein
MKYSIQQSIFAMFVAAAAISAIVLTGCKKELDKPQPIVLTSAETLTLLADQTEGQTITFTATSAWTVSVSEIDATKSATATPEWISISPASGNAGSHTLTLTIQPNNTDDTRTALITITVDGTQAQVTVIQQTADPQPTGEYDVYIFGSRGSGSYLKYGYWKNGTFVEKGVDFNIQQALVSDNDLYLVKTTYGSANRCSVLKNMQSTELEYSSPNARIAVSGSDIYAVESGITSAPAYWKNGQSVSLPFPDWTECVAQVSSVMLNGIAVEENKVFVGGDYCYWINGVCHVTTDADCYEDGALITQKWFDWHMGDIFTDKLAVLNGKCLAIPRFYSSDQGAYIKATEVTYNGEVAWDYYAAYWSIEGGNNGSIIKLEQISGSNDGHPHGQLRDLIVSNGDIYVGGYLYDEARTNYAVYWKNGQKTVLASNSQNTWITKIQVIGNDVFVFGYYANKQVVWKNGEIIFTAKPEEYENISHFAVLPHDPNRTW